MWVLLDLIACFALKGTLAQVHFVSPPTLSRLTLWLSNKVTPLLVKGSHNIFSIGCQHCLTTATIIASF